MIKISNFSLRSEHDKHGMETPYEELTQQQQNERREQFCVKLADFLFSTKTTIQIIMQPKIFDKVIDGTEFRLIKHRHFIRLIKRAGLSLSYNDEMCIKNLIQSVFNGCIDLSALEHLLSNLGIEDEKPASNKHLDYSKLSGEAIRIFNKINHDMNEHNLDELEDFLGKQNLDKIEAVIGGKTQTLDVLTATKLKDILKDKGIINYGQDLDDDFIRKLQ